VKAFIPPARHQQLDGDQREHPRQQDNGFVTVGEKEMAEGRQEVLKSTHLPLPRVDKWPPATGQGRWLGADTLIER
jgi:hypothetical protein